MLMYDCTMPDGSVISINQNVIDQVFLANGLANGSIVSRPATYSEQLAECYRQRLLGYPSVDTQLDAAFHARNGSTTQQVAVDAQIAAVKAQYPKPVQTS